MSQRLREEIVRTIGEFVRQGKGGPEMELRAGEYFGQEEKEKLVLQRLEWFIDEFPEIAATFYQLDLKPLCQE